jgi:ribose 5-phosphate isomerase B
MSHYKNIVIVGTNNTTRSYMAEAVLKRLTEEYGLDGVKISSRGLVVLFPEPVNPKAAQAVGNAGYKIKEFLASKLTREDLEEADLVLTITTEEKERILADYESYVKDISKVYTLSEFAGEKIGIPNPYGKEAEDYAACFITVKRMCEKCFENKILKK